jgi:hypothetical protein
MASISASVNGARRNRCGSSFRSKYSPFAGTTEPRECPEVAPRPPSPSGADELRPNGPCCWACCRYDEKDGEDEEEDPDPKPSGNLWVGEAGCA